jgi:hypothetical protein
VNLKKKSLVIACLLLWAFDRTSARLLGAPQGACQLGCRN